MLHKLARSRLASASLISSVLLVVAGMVAFASIPDAGVINGCYATKTGALRVIDTATQSCAKGEIALSWNQVGPTGLTGATGAAGPQGASGAQGPQGVIGATGATGATGPNGATGAAGPKGDTGVVGSTGPAGPVGPDGAPGAAGAPGTNGANGTNGTNGTSVIGAPADIVHCPYGGAAFTAATSPGGPGGPVGSGITYACSGAPGTNGTNGIDGAAGAVGPAGPAGAVGPAGPQGPVGPAGSTTYVTSRISFSFTQNFARVLTLPLPAGSYLFTGYAQFLDAGNPQDDLVTCELQGTGYVISSFSMVIKDASSPQNVPIGGAATLLAPDTVGLDCQGASFTFLGGPVGAFLSATTTTLVVTTG